MRRTGARSICCVLPARAGTGDRAPSGKFFPELAQRFAERSFRDALVGAGPGGRRRPLPELVTPVLRHISLVQLYEDNREKLMLNWVVGQRVDRRIGIKVSSQLRRRRRRATSTSFTRSVSRSWARGTRLGHACIGERRFAHLFHELLLAKPPAVFVATV